MLGVPARIDKIKSIRKKYNLALIEDTAWGCGAKFKQKYLGTWGDIGAFSFDFAKTITTGEGGCSYSNQKKNFLKPKPGMIMVTRIIQSTSMGRYSKK